MGSKKLFIYLAEALAIVISIIFLFPLFYAFINSFKEYGEMMTSYMSFPKSFYLGNYVKAWKAMNYIKSFFNSFTVTVFSVAGIIFFSSMASYKLARTKDRKSWFIYLLFTFGMIIPFHAIMIPLVKLAAFLHLTKSIPGLVVIYWGLGCPLAVFLYHGFIKGVPVEIEEAAEIDGCSPFRKFFSVVMPLLTPVTSTIAILDVLWVWNDFLLPMLVIFLNRSIRTIPLTQYNLYGEYNSEWNVAIAAVIMGVVPCIVFFLFMQKYIIKGVTAGSVKG